MEKRHILAIVLMTLVMILWSVFFAPKPKPPTESEKQIQTETETAQEPQTPVEEKKPITENPSKISTADSPTFTVTTDKYEVVFAIDLAVPQKWSLKEFPDRSDDQTLPWNLIPENALQCLAVEFSDSNLKLNEMTTKWQIEGGLKKIDLTANNANSATLTFYKTISDQLRIVKKITFYKDRYFVDFDLTFQNLSDQASPVFNSTAKSYKLFWGPGIKADLLEHELKNKSRGRYAKGEGVYAYVGFGKPQTDLDEKSQTATIKWTGISNKYFAALIIPDPAILPEYEHLGEPIKNAPIDLVAPKELASIVIPSFNLKSRQTRTDLYRIYVGPKDSNIMKKITHRDEVLQSDPDLWIGLEKIIDFGFFWPIAWVMLWMLNAFHFVFRNYGVAIILLTAIVKLISFPLTKKSQESMKAMQKLQPEIEALREKHRDDPQKLNQATMLLYKRHNVNPFGGCFPMIPQLPIFWALFSLLGNAVELRGEGFLFWIDDLTAPDLIFTLPFSLPLIGNALRLLPIVNAATTWLQTKTSGQAPAADNSQAKMMQFLPFAFIFLFYNWASGFVLYWMSNNIFTIAQNLIFKSKIDKDLSKQIKKKEKK